MRRKALLTCAMVLGSVAAALPLAAEADRSAVTDEALEACHGRMPCEIAGSGRPRRLVGQQLRSLRDRSDALSKRAEAIGGAECEDGSGAICGTLQVPLDWSSRRGPTTGFAWKLYVHTGSQASVSTITFNWGGPGERTIYPGDGGVHYVLGPLFETHDVLLFDDRGRGQSGALDCPALQHEVGPLEGRVTNCVRQLGPSAGFYASASIAKDLEALRAKLGIERFDYIGNSYGTMDALAYASRYPRRIRSIVVGAGYGSTQFDFATMVSTVAAGIRRNISSLCERSRPCHEAIPDAMAELRWGARYLRNHPLEGDTTTPEGRPAHVRLTEARLAFIAGLGDSFGALNAGELPAALVALRRGDSAPILRIAVQTSDVTEFFWSDGGEASDFSVASFLATECVDNRTPPWGPGLTSDQREAAALQRLRRVSERDLAPWSADSLMELPGLVFEDQMLACRYWPDMPGAEGAVVDPAALPDVPVLGLSSGLDIVGGAVKAELRRFPQSQYVDVGVTPHPATTWRCGPARIQEFLENLGTVAANCGDDPEPAWHAQPSFPKRSVDAEPLSVARAGGDASTKADRRTAAVAVEAVLDTWWQRQRTCCGPSSGKGLRGGAWSWDFTPDGTGFSLSLDAARFADDVAVTGTLFVPFDPEAAAEAHIALVGPKSTTGKLTLKGTITFWSPAGSGLDVTGEIGGRSIALRAAVG